jgi:hypothetical protein
LIKKYSVIFHNNNSVPVIFVFCKDEEETGTAGEQPDSNTLYGYTARREAFKSSFFFCRYPFIAKKTQR